MLAEIEAEKSDEYTSWESIKTERAYNGNISLRIPKDLHRTLVTTFKLNGYNTITGGVYFCDVGFYKTLDTHVVELFSVFL
ncbi:MAG: type II toxin-antitoxin system HicB family antitoxin [Defluviitaleaceae bacterium]|nr:type II toxin-antitoxin system HicB family antitoxin [Defluviitaleaceae bacterium]